MEIMNKLVDSGRFSRDVATAKYGQAPKVKLCKKEYADTIRSVHLSSRINLSEIIIRTHKTNPYMSIDEIIGDLQIVLMESWNEFRRLNYDVEMGSLSIDDLLNDLPMKIKQ